MISTRQALARATEFLDLAVYVVPADRLWCDASLCTSAMRERMKSFLRTAARRCKAPSAERALARVTICHGPNALFLDGMDLTVRLDMGVCRTKVLLSVSLVILFMVTFCAWRKACGASHASLE